MPLPTDQPPTDQPPTDPQSDLLTISLTADHLERLDLGPAIAILQTWRSDPPPPGQSLQFQIDFPRELGDPRELSEIPEVRLWFIRLDAAYPWLPILLDWKAGELARYVAMLVPHQFHPTEGIQFNPEGLEIWVMAKIFVLQDWFKGQGTESRSAIKAMAQLLGYELDDGLFDLIAQPPSGDNTARVS
jgi:hypothetical protein